MIKAALFLLLSFSMSVQAQTYADALAKAPVNHLQLVANNLNMLFLIKGEDLEFSPEDGISSALLRFMQTNDNQILARAFLIAPVSKLSKKFCQDQMNQFKSAIQPNLLMVLTPFDPSHTELESLSSSFRYEVILQAEENKDLRIDCAG